MNDEQAKMLQLTFCGMSFNSPLVLLSGCVGFGEEYTRVQGFSHDDVGAVCLKGTTLEPRLGNPPHRVYETPYRHDYTGAVEQIACRMYCIPLDLNAEKKLAALQLPENDKLHVFAVSGMVNIR